LCKLQNLGDGYMGIHYKICSTVLHVSNVNSKMWGREDNQPVAAWETGTWAWGWLLGAHSGPTFGEAMHQHVW
jgi:hypothetical protein